jgi:CheY-like chemotaxis protein
LSTEAERTPTRVLLIDDSREFAEVMAVLLKEWGCDVSVAYDAEMALSEAAKGPIDVLFSDLRLPDLSGAELLPLLQQLETCRDMVCVSLSAHESEEAETLSRDAGFLHHLSKPPSLKELKSVLPLD